MTISNADAIELLTAIKMTAGIKMDQKSTWNMAKNARLIKGVVSDVEEARSRLIKQFDSSGKGTITNQFTDAEGKTTPNPDWIPFITALQEVMNVRTELNLSLVPLSKLPIDAVDAALTTEDPNQSQLYKGVFSLLVDESA